MAAIRFDSDILPEAFWTKNGQWVGNRHNYMYARLQRDLSHMVHLEGIQVDPGGFDFAKLHPKNEVIGPKQYSEEWQPSDLTQISFWRRSSQSMVHEVVQECGTRPSNSLDNNSSSYDLHNCVEEDRWSYFPVHYDYTQDVPRNRPPF